MHIPRSSGINYYEADGPKNGYEPMIKEQFLMVAFAGQVASDTASGEPLLTTDTDDAKLNTKTHLKPLPETT